MKTKRKKYGIIVTFQSRKLGMVLKKLFESGISGHDIAIQSSRDSISQEVISEIYRLIPTGIEYIEYPITNAAFEYNLNKYCKQIIDLRCETDSISSRTD